MTQLTPRRLTLAVGLTLGVATVAILVVALGPKLGPSTDDQGQVVAQIDLADPADVYDPVAAGEPLPDGYRSLLARDQIEPVYQPQFTRAGNVDWPGESLVVGVAGSATAKAYPVTHLNQREMVIDSLEGIPILVTW